jgi:NAD(P)-dependent dehydrogenase (short-subunit alcohol dehydrogenase family)
MMMKDKVAVVYGAGGAIGGAVARAFAAEGAKLFLTGRHLTPVEAVAKDVVAAGGSAEAAEVDAAELAPQGIRVVGLRPQGMPETGRIKESFELYANASGMTWEQFHELGAGRTHTRRLSTLAELANVAVFMASDQASGMTGTVVNLSMGSLDD